MVGKRSRHDNGAWGRIDHVLQMNVFFTSQDPMVCAKDHWDEALIPQLKDAAKILSNCCERLGVWDKRLYLPNHTNTPHCKWAAKSIYNVEWLVMLAFELNAQYLARNRVKGKCIPDHKILDIVTEVWDILTLRRNVNKIPQGKFETPPQTVPVKYRKPGETAKAYQTWLCVEKRTVTWSIDPPKWWPLKTFVEEDFVFFDD